MPGATTGAVDLSGIKDRVAKERDHLTSLPPLSPEDEEAVAALAAAHPEDVPDHREPVATAFVVFVTREGQVVGSPDLNIPIVPDRAPSPADLYGACANILKDIQAMESAQQAHQLQLQFAQAMAQRQQSQQVLAALPKNLRG
jgi:hypothetical protein